MNGSSKINTYFISNQNSQNNDEKIEYKTDCIKLFQNLASGSAEYSNQIYEIAMREYLDECKKPTILTGSERQIGHCKENISMILEQYGNKMKKCFTFLLRDFMDNVIASPEFACVGDVYAALLGSWSAVKESTYTYRVLSDLVQLNVNSHMQKNHFFC